MKKIFSILSILFISIVYGQSNPITTVNNIRITAPVEGTINDSLIVRRASDGVLRYYPISDLKIPFIKSNEPLTGAKRKGDLLYGILDQYTGEEVTLNKVVGTPTVDGVIYFQLGSEYFKRNYNAVNVKWFGAVGDSITDDRSAIMAAVATMHPNLGGTVYMPEGNIFTTSDRIDTKAPYTKFVGGAKLVYKPNKVGIVFMHDYCSVQGLSFEGEVTASSSVNAGLFIQGASFGKVEKCNFKFNGHGVCVFSGNSYKGEVLSENSPTGNVIDGNIFESKGVYGSLENYSGVLMGFAVEKPVIGNKVINNYVYGNFVVDHGIALIGAGYDNIIDNNTIYDTRSYGVVLYQTELLTDYSVHHNKVSNNIIDGVGVSGTLKGMGIYTQKAHYTTVSNNTVSNCEIGAGVEGVLAQSGISIDGGIHNNVTGNIVFDIQSGKPGIRVNNSFFTNVIGNNVENDATGISITESNNVDVVDNTIKNTAMSSIFVIGGETQSTLSPPYDSIPSGLSINITDNEITNTASDANVIDVSGADGFFIDGVNIEGNTLDILGNGMNLVTVKNGIISNNTIISNLATGKNGILLNSVTDNLQVSDNRIYSKSGSYNYGIYSDGTTNRVLANYITNAVTPISNSGPTLSVTDTALIFNKNLSVNNISTTGEIDGSFFSITTPGSLNSDFNSKGSAVRLTTTDGTIFRGIYDSGFCYFQIGGNTQKVRLTAGAGTAMESLNVDADTAIFSGKATVATAPTNPTDVVRLTDLTPYALDTDVALKANIASPTFTGTVVVPTAASNSTSPPQFTQVQNLTGWAQYSGSDYTIGSPLVISAGNTSVLANNGSTSSITSQLPTGVTAFVNTANGKITPQNDGDFYVIDIRFKATSSAVDGVIDIGIDIGGAMGIIRQHTVALRKGIGVEQRVALSFPVFSGSTFVSNGGEVKVTSVAGNTSIYDVTFVIDRTHKAK